MMNAENNATEEAQASVESLTGIVKALGKLIAEGKKDPTVWDRMADRIRQRQADGMIEEALGYVPAECKTTPQGDSFKRVTYTSRKGTKE